MATTGTLEWQDIDTFSKWQADTYGGGLSLLGPSLAPHLDEGESATGKALAAISPAQIVITDTANESQNVDDLRRDTANTNRSLPGLPDLQNILREQLKTQQLYQDAAAKAAKAIVDISLKLEQAARTPEERAYWAEGGVGRAALHALAGGLLGRVTDVNGIINGALGGASSALLGPSIRQLVAEIVDSANIADPALRTFLINSVSSGIIEGIGAGIGGSEGAAYAGNAFQQNYLTHAELEEFQSRINECGNDSACIESVEAERTLAWSERQQENIEICNKDVDACSELIGRMQGDLAQLLANREAFAGPKPWIEADIAGLLSLEWTMLESLSQQGKLSADQQAKLNQYRATPLPKLVEAKVLVTGLGRNVGRPANSAQVESYFVQNLRFWTKDPVEYGGNRVYQRNDLINPAFVDPRTGLSNP